ncbi:MAG: hypothetical protein JWO30_4017 [Fibrobacteres bacterium]|nr:hypothetical protein [Fibrobacterota bacterium]
MSYHIAVSKTDNLLRMDVTGTRVPGQVVEDAKECWMRLSEEFEKDDTCRVMGVFDLTGKKTFFESYQIFENPGKFNIERTSTIAIVYLNGDTYAEDKFGETVARNRAWNVKVCCTESEALSWLASQRGIRQILP